MNQNIPDWHDFDGGKFQRLCNALLKLEFGKDARVYSKEGKDKGIDQLFNGTYGARTGKWRIQDKFHNSGNREKDLSALKHDIKEDIDKNFDGEDFLAFFTNVNLLPQQAKEFEDHGNAEIKKKKSRAEFILYSHSEIETFLIAHPLAATWFWPTATILLQPYEDYFSKQLNPSTTDLRYQLANKFFGRTDALKKLLDFTNTSTKSTAAVIANGGFGKTRLIVELFSSDEINRSEFLPVVLSKTHFSPAELYDLLNSKERFLILIDDAHEEPAVVRQVKELIEQFGAKHKLILTTRPTLFSIVSEKIPTYAKDIEKIPLAPLSYEETKSMMQNELPHISEENRTALIAASKFVPLVILEQVRLIQQGRNPNTITHEDVFLEAVNKIINEAADDAEKTLGISPIKTKEIFRVIALISPITLSDKDTAFIASVTELREDKVRDLLSHLEENGMISTIPTVSIKPDPYSDVVLAQTIQKHSHFVTHLMKSAGAEEYIENILKNISETEIPDQQRGAFVDEILTKYIRQLETINDPRQIGRIFDVIKHITPYKPFAGIYGIEQFFKIYADETHNVHKTVPGQWSDEKVIDHIRTTVKEIAFSLVNRSKFGQDNRERMLSLAMKYVEITGEASILLSIYGYHEWHFAHGRYHPAECCSMQHSLQKEIISLFKQGITDWQFAFCLAGSKVLLATEYKLPDSFNPFESTFSYGEGIVPFCEHVKPMRLAIIKSMIAFAENSVRDEQKNQITKELLDYFRRAAEHVKGHPSQPFNDEVPIVFEFFKQILSNNPSIEIKSITWNYANRFKAKGYKEPFKNMAGEIIDLASETSSPTDHLDFLLDAHMPVQDLETATLKIIKEFPNYPTFVQTLVSLRVARKHYPHNFSTMLFAAGKQYPEDSKQLFTELKASHPKYVGELLRLIQPSYKDKAFTDKLIKDLWAEKETNLQNLLHTLTIGRNLDRTQYSVEELAYFEYAIDQKQIGLYSIIAYYLPEYAYLDKDNTFRILDKLIKQQDPGSLSALTHTLLNEEHAYAATFKDDIKKLYLNNIESYRYDDDELIFFYRFVERHYGLDELIDTMVNVISEGIKRDTFWFISDNFIYRGIANSEQELEKNYVAVLEKYLAHSAEHPDAWEAVLRSFRPKKNISNSLAKLIIDLSLKEQGSLTQLETIAATVHSFESDTERLEVLSYIAKLVLDLDEDANLDNIYGKHFLANLERKTYFQSSEVSAEDEHKKVLLESFLQSPPIDLPEKARNALAVTLEKVKKDIDDAMARTKKSTSW